MNSTDNCAALSNADQADKRHKQQAAADQRARREQVAVTLNTTATCRSCQATKPQEEFPKTKIDWATRRSSWVQRYASTCTECCSSTTRSNDANGRSGTSGN